MSTRRAGNCSTARSTPNGTLNAVLGGQLLRNLFTFEDMLATNRAGSHIEVGPELLPGEAEPDQAAPAMQEAIAL